MSKQMIGVDLSSTVTSFPLQTSSVWLPSILSAVCLSICLSVCLYDSNILLFCLFVCLQSLSSFLFLCCRLDCLLFCLSASMSDNLLKRHRFLMNPGLWQRLCPFLLSFTLSFCLSSSSISPHYPPVSCSPVYMNPTIRDKLVEG
jgi:hypothetical protein